jgi:predicted transcriptional regulator
MYVHNQGGINIMNVLETSKVLSDLQALRIISMTQKKPCSAQELSEELNSPLAGVYKKIKELENAGFIKDNDRILMPYGKRVTRYRSLVRGFYVQFYNNELRVTLELDSDEKTVRMTWNPLQNI